MPGVAIGTLVAEWTGLAIGLWLCRDAFAGAQWRDWGRVFDPVRLRRMAQVNGDILVRSVILQASFTSFLFFGAGLGDVTLAANQVRCSSSPSPATRSTASPSPPRRWSGRPSARARGPSCAAPPSSPPPGAPASRS